MRPGTVNDWALSSRCNSACHQVPLTRGYPTLVTSASLLFLRQCKHRLTSQPLRLLCLKCPPQISTLFAPSLPSDSVQILHQKGLS